MVRDSKFLNKSKGHQVHFTRQYSMTARSIGKPAMDGGGP